MSDRCIDRKGNRQMSTTITRDRLLTICERAFVPESKWHNRDSSDAQRQLGEAYSLLRAGCDFTAHVDGRTIWVEIEFEGFGYFDWGGAKDSERFYLPTEERLDSRGREGGDWY